LAFFDNKTFYQQICIKKYLRKPLNGVSVEFLFRKIYPTPYWFLAAILDLSFIFYKNQFAEWKNLYSLLFAKFSKINSQKSAIVPPF
jgi:hypothetical protein